jgi:hypothetical protein
LVVSGLGSSGVLHYPFAYPTFGHSFRCIRDAVAKGMKIFTSQQPAIQHQWNFGGMYFATPDKLDPKVPLVKKEVRQAMNIAINRQAIADNILGGQVEPHRIMGYHRELDSAIWPGIWNPEWDAQFGTLYGYNPAKAKDSVGYWYGHPVIEDRIEALGKVADREERARLLREIGDHKFYEFAEMPLF